MSAAGDIECDSVGAIVRSQRRIAIAPFDELLLQLFVSRRVVQHDAKRGQQRPRIGQSRSGPDAGVACRIVDSGDLKAAFLLPYHRQWRRGAPRIFALQTIHHQARKEQAQKPPLHLTPPVWLRR